MISVVVPLFNEAANLDSLYHRLKATADTWQETWEIIFVDDGSTDESLSILYRLNKVDARVKCVSFSRNFGHQTAVSAGLQYARGSAVVIMDADLQDPPEEVVRFIEKWRSGFQVVYGIRAKRKENAAKRIAYFLFYRLLARLAPIEIPLDSGDFCLMDRVVVDRLNTLPERNRFIRGLRSWIGYRQTGVIYERQTRFAGDVKYTFRKLVRLALDGIINFSHRPLQIIAGFGFIAAFFSFLVLSFMFVAWLFDFKVRGISVSQLPGYTSIILSILFIGGIQLVSLGILGEYIGRIFDEVKQRPLFIVRSSIGLEARDSSSPHADGQNHRF